MDETLQERLLRENNVMLERVGSLLERVVTLLETLAEREERMGKLAAQIVLDQVPDGRA